MDFTRRAVLGAAATVGVAGCLNGNDAARDSPETEPATETAMTETEMETTMAETETEMAETETTETGSETTVGDAATVRVGTHSELGDVLVGPDGMTLYMFDQDSRGESASTCSGGCADVWPPLTADGEPTRGEGVTAELTTFERENGDLQAAAGGWPLYYFASDASPGDAKGQGVNGVWWVLAPDGTPVR